MNNLAENLDPQFDSVEAFDDFIEADIIEFDSTAFDPFPVNFMDELDGWVRHSLAMNGFADF